MVNIENKPIKSMKGGAFEVNVWKAKNGHDVAILKHCRLRSVDSLGKKNWDSQEIRFLPSEKDNLMKALAII